MREKIEKIKKEFESGKLKRQSYVHFTDDQLSAVLEAEKVLGMPKDLAISVCCKLAVELLEEKDGE